MEETFQLSKNMIMSAIGMASPKAAELLAEYGLHCLTCFANQFDTLEQGAIVHGFDDDEIEEMINDVNEELRKEENRKAQKGSGQSKRLPRSS